jgi:hypothetical protein
MPKTRILNPDNQGVARSIPAQRIYKSRRGKAPTKQLCLIEIVAHDPDDDMVEIPITASETVRFERERFMQALAIAEQRED